MSEIDWADNDDFDDDFMRDDDTSEPLGNDEWVLDCGYEGCCMPGYHFRSECHNAEDMEAMYAEHEQSVGKPEVNSTTGESR